MILVEKILLEANNTIQIEVDSLIKKYKSLGMICMVHYIEEYNALELSAIRIKDKKQRHKGLGSQFMNDFVSLCDKYHLVSFLSPDDVETPGDVLTKFYKKYGFVDFKSNRKDEHPIFTHSMIRQPK